MKKIIAFVLLASIVVSSVVFCGCSNSYTDPTDGIETLASTDKYRNYYEIFVGSFCDSNNDGIGDLQGIISKLDYLNDGNPETDDDLGIDGIWLTPIMPSHSYHKYDVKDYFDIDKDFGTMEDFDKLVKECHKRGINIIIDMVLNHSSKFLPLFENACKQALQGNLEDDAKYFEIEHYDDNPGDAYTSIGKGYYYESNFSPYMPEWNLNQECTRDYFMKIADFWLNDHNVDGFRLDACKFYDSNKTDGEKFLEWYYNEVKKIKPDVYMVGEHWTGNAEIQDLYNSKIDSLFAFGFAGVDGEFVNSVRTKNGSSLIPSIQKYESKTKDSNEQAINSYFLSNHDQIRSGNYLKITGESGTKMAAATYMLMPGNSFIYYGEEIGMTQDSQSEGDEYKREPMVWDSNKLPEIKVNGITGSDESQVQYGGVAQQQENENSILNFYKRIVKIKNQNPEIARGTINKVEDFDDNAVCAYYIEYKDSRVMIIHNFSDVDSKEITLTDEMLKNPVLRGDLVASNGVDEEGNTVQEHISLSGSTLKLPPRSTAVLKPAE